MPDILTTLILSAIVFATALAFGINKCSLRSFVSADGSLPTGIAGLSLFMSFFSAGTFVAWGSVAYSEGIVAISIQASIGLAAIVVAFLVAPRWYKTGASTVSEYLDIRFGKKIKTFYSIIFFIISVFSSGAFLYAISVILSSFLGIKINCAIIAIGILCIGYVAAGGIWSVAVSDVIELIVLSVALVVAVPLSLKEVTPLGNIPQNFLSPATETYDWGFLLAFGIYNAVYLGGSWNFVQKTNSTRSSASARKAVLLFSVLYLVFPILWTVPSLCCRFTETVLSGSDVENAFMIMCSKVLPKGMTGVLTAGLLFASLSSINSMLNAASSVIANDFLKPPGGEIKESTLMKKARLSCILFGVAIIGIALMTPKLGGIVNLIVTLAALTGCPVYLPAVWSLFSRRINGKSMVAVSCISLAVNIFLKFALPVLTGISLGRTEEMVVGVCLPFVLLAAVEFIRRKEETTGFTPILRKVGMSEESVIGRRILFYGMLATGILLIAVGCLTDDNNMAVIISGIAISLISTIYKFLTNKSC